MNLALWIVAGALAVMFALSGLMMLGVPKGKLVARHDQTPAAGAEATPEPAGVGAERRRVTACVET